VSTHLDILDVDYNDIIEGVQAHPGSFRATLTPRARGVKIAKIAIAPQRAAPLFRPFGDISGYVFSRGLGPSRAAALMFVMSAIADAFSIILCSHSWCVCFYDLVLYSEILYIV
jgi:hypothetical protein